MVLESSRRPRPQPDTRTTEKTAAPWGLFGTDPHLSRDIWQPRHRVQMQDLAYWGAPAITGGSNATQKPAYRIRGARRKRLVNTEIYPGSSALTPLGYARVRGYLVIFRPP